MGYLEIIPQAKSQANAEQFFAELHAILHGGFGSLFKRRPHVSLELHGYQGRVRFYLWAPDEEASIVTKILQSAYPGAELRPADDPLTTDGWYAFSSLGLRRSSEFPISVRLAADGMAPLLDALADTRGEERVHVQFLIRPRIDSWKRAARRHAQSLRGQPTEFARLVFNADQQRPSLYALEQAKLIEEKVRYMGFDVSIQIAARGQRAIDHVRTALAYFKLFGEYNAFVSHRVWFKREHLEAMRSRSFTRSFILVSRELAPLWQLPQIPPYFVATTSAIKLPPPFAAVMSERVIGVSTYPGIERPVGISLNDAFRHTWIGGPTGVGKSTLLLNLICADIEAGHGVMVLDPKSDLVAAVLERIPRHRLEDVILIRPEDADYSIGINPLEWKDKKDRDLIRENVIAIFQRIYAQWWGIRTADFLRHTLQTLLERPDSTLLEIVLLLSDATFRRKLLEEIDDPWLKSTFWDQFEKMSNAQRNEAISPLLTKLRDFLTPRVRRIISQRRSTVDMADVLNGGKILLADLSGGLWGETTASLLGSFLVTKLWQEARQRGSLADDQRRPFLVYVDEFQQFMSAATSFAETLAQARSYRLGLVLANQHLAQLTEDVRRGLASNARSKIVFQLGIDDARDIAREFAPLDPQALMSLPRYEFAARISVNGETSAPFTAKSLPPPKVDDPTIAAEIAEASRRKYGRPVTEIDAELMEYLNVGERNGDEGSEERQR